MLLPLLVGDQRGLVLLLLSLPQQPLLVRLDAPTCASFNRRIQDQFQLKKTENGIETRPHANISFNVWPSSNWIGERKSKS